MAGPLLLTAVLASGGRRAGYLAPAGIAALVWLGAYLRGPKPAGARSRA